MQRVRHENVLKLEGIVIEDNMPLIILPFITNGDLKTYVEKYYHVSLSSFYISVSFTNENETISHVLSAAHLWENAWSGYCITFIFLWYYIIIMNKLNHVICMNI